MAFIIPTGSSIAVDPCDALFIAPRTVGLNDYATLYVASGQPILVDALPTDLADELDEAAFGPAPSQTLWATVAVALFPSPVLVAGQQVRTIEPTPDALGCTLRLAQATTTLLAPALTVADAVVALDATSGCGGGGGGSDATYSDSGVWEGTAVDTTGTLTLSTPIPTTWERQGQASEAPDAAAGDIITLHLVLVYEGTLDATPIVELTDLPAPADTSGGYSYTGAPFTPSAALMTLVDDDTIRLTWLDATGGPVNGVMLFDIHYQVAGV